MRKTPRRLAEMFVTASTSMFLSVGCGEKKDSPDAKANVAVQGTVPAQTTSSTPTTPQAETSHFAAHVLRDSPDPGQTTDLPPHLTYTKKSVAKIFEAVAGVEGKPGLWDQVSFVDSKGRKIRHFAVLKTDKGDIRIELLSDSAPNHVRNFVALTRAGFFDGLPFHKSLRDEKAGRVSGYLEAGCPKGTGEFGQGSVGYWLKPEITDDLAHMDGTLGTWSSKHSQTGEDLGNATCKFYIALGQNRGLDGNYTIFGKVVQGLDVAHTINATPVKEDDALAGNRNLIHIRQVLIEEVVDSKQIAAN